MKQYKPVDYYDHITQQHKWYAQKWDEQHSVPSDATNQVFDFSNWILSFNYAGESHETKVLTPPPWVKKRLKE